MKPEFELELDSDGGTIRTIYQDGVESFAEELGAEVSSVCRASTVEWEEVQKPVNARFPLKKGWAVRSAKDQRLALRYQSIFYTGVGARYIDDIVCSRNEALGIVLFANREAALEYEVKFFWNLMHGKES